MAGGGVAVWPGASGSTWLKKSLATYEPVHWPLVTWIQSVLFVPSKEYDPPLIAAPTTVSPVLTVPTAV